MDEQVVRSDPDIAIAGILGPSAVARSESVEDGADAERLEDMRRNLEVELPPDLPGGVS